MILTDPSLRVTLSGIPRESGDDPATRCRSVSSLVYSPQEWG